MIAISCVAPATRMAEITPVMMPNGPQAKMMWSSCCVLWLRYCLTMESPKSARSGAVVCGVSMDACGVVRGRTEVGEEVIGEVVAGTAGVRGGDGGEEENQVGSPCGERAGERLESPAGLYATR